MTSPFTLVLFAGALYLVIRFQNLRWRLLAPAYASSADRPAKAVKRFATVVARGGMPFFTKYVGVSIAIHDDGLGLRIVPPFSFGAPPLLLPFDEMTVRRTDWYLNSGSFSIRMKRDAGVELIIDEELFSWIQANTNRCELEV
jgi:hypothetical protein